VTSTVYSVAISLDSNPAGGALSGTTVRTTVNGVATFDDLRIDRAGSGYRLRASATNGFAPLPAAASAAFAVTP
jgi:hypothetical protein